MPTAFILANVAQGEIDAAADGLSDFEDVVEVYSVAGEYDLIIKVQVEDYERFADVIPDRLQSVQELEETETLMAFKTFKF
ncbi:MAG: Lrp/AsnC family transcriptional regulator [Halococcoides sp.]